MELNTASGQHGAQSDKQVSSESIQIVTSISDAIVQDDGNITPRAATVITTGVFENGVPLRPVQQDLGILDSNNTHVPLLANQFVITDPGLDGRTNSQATLPNSTSDQQQTQQQQRQRELHYENANAVLVPPLNFAMVAPGVYRSGHPNKNNFPFMRKLGLKVIV